MDFGGDGGMEFGGGGGMDFGGGGMDFDGGGGVDFGGRLAGLLLARYSQLFVSPSHKTEEPLLPSMARFHGQGFWGLHPANLAFGFQ